MTFGDAPTHESKEIDLFGDMDFEMPEAKGSEGSNSPELTGDPDIDQFLMDEDDDDEPGFTDIDDLDGLI